MNCREENCEFVHGGGECKHASTEVKFILFFLPRPLKNYIKELILHIHVIPLLHRRNR